MGGRSDGANGSSRLNQPAWPAKGSPKHPETSSNCSARSGRRDRLPRRQICETRTKSAAPKTQTVTLPVTVLGIDSNFEPATLAAYQYREKNVYPHITVQGYAVDKCQGPMAKRI